MMILEPNEFRQTAENIVYGAPDSYSSADLVDAIETAIRTAVVEERESIAESAEAAADAWRPYLREFAAFVRARNRDML